MNFTTKTVDFTQTRLNLWNFSIVNDEGNIIYCTPDINSVNAQRKMLIAEAYIDLIGKDKFNEYYINEEFDDERFYADALELFEGKFIVHVNPINIMLTDGLPKSTIFQIRDHNQEILNDLAEYVSTELALKYFVMKLNNESDAEHLISEKEYIQENIPTKEEYQELKEYAEEVINKCNEILANLNK